MSAPADPREPVIDRWGHLMGQPSGSIPLDEAALMIAQCDHPRLDMVDELARLDGLAALCPSPTFDGVVRYLLDDLGFRGNVERYDDPSNSFLDVVVERRTGLPITLSVLTIEVARRVGVELHGVSLPGHFIVGSSDTPGRFVDPFNGSTIFDADGARALFRRVSNGSTQWDDSWLSPVDTRAIVARMLNNLKNGFQRRGDVIGLWWALRLRARVSAELMTDDMHDHARLVAGLN